MELQPTIQRNDYLYKLYDGRLVHRLLAPKNAYGGPLLWELSDGTYLISGGFQTLQLRTVDNHETISNHSVIDTLRIYHNNTCIAHEKMHVYLLDTNVRSEL